MTEFNNFNLEKEENISAEESKISSAEGAFEQEDELSFKRALETQEKTAEKILKELQRASKYVKVNK